MYSNRYKQGVLQYGPLGSWGNAPFFIPLRGRCLSEKGIIIVKAADSVVQNQYSVLLLFCICARFSDKAWNGTY